MTAQQWTSALRGLVSLGGSEGDEAASTTRDAAAAMVYARNLSDGSAAVCLYNPSDEPAAGSFDFASLGWPALTVASVRNLWLHTSEGDASGRYPSQGNVSVEAHGTVMLRLTPHTHPW